ncbi:hypothetical protein D3C72_2558000 [compost metagenome]
MQMGETDFQVPLIITNEELIEYEAPRPDWNCLKDYGISDEEYSENEVYER